jgi:hypothetical protein
MHDKGPSTGLAIAIALCLASPPALGSAGPSSDPATHAWRAKRTRLGIGVGLSAALALSGIAAMIVGAGKTRGGTLYAGIGMFAAGGVATSATASAFVHHDRWHFGAQNLGEERRALASRTRRVAIAGIAISMAAVVGGSIAIGLSVGRPLSGANVGVGVLGLAATGLGLSSLGAFATIRGLHDRHRHDRVTARVTAGVGALRMTF